jgi:hypothetical protein
LGGAEIRTKVLLEHPDGTVDSFFFDTSLIDGSQAGSTLTSGPFFDVASLLRIQDDSLEVGPSAEVIGAHSPFGTIPGTKDASLPAPATGQPTDQITPSSPFGQRHKRLDCLTLGG